MMEGVASSTIHQSPAISGAPSISVPHQSTSDPNTHLVISSNTTAAAEALVDVDEEGEEARRRRVLATLANDTTPYSDEENAMIAKGERAIDDFLKNEKKEKVSPSASTRKSSSFVRFKLGAKGDFLAPTRKSSSFVFQVGAKGDFLAPTRKSSSSVRFKPGAKGDLLANKHPLLLLLPLPPD
jgi:hypothetical protein